MLSQRSASEEKKILPQSQFFKISGLKSQPMDVKSTYKSILPDYIVLYVFKGTFQRGGVGHIAMWDGTSYYSYGQGNGGPWIEENYSFAKSEMRASLENKVWHYGPYKKIVLPYNLYLSENYDAIRSNIASNWKSNAYSAMKKNCAHMVQDYLVQANYTIPIPDYVQFPLYPSEVAGNAENIGKALVEKIINDIKAQFVTTDYQMRLYKYYLDFLKEKLSYHPMLNAIQQKELLEEMRDDVTDQEKFCRVFSIVAHHHYDRTSFADEIHACDKFYENMFIEALHVSAHHPKFEKEPQIYKTGSMRTPIAITRAMVGAVILPVLAIIAFIPMCLYKLYGWLVSKKSAKKNTPPILAQSDRDSTVINRKGSTKRISATIPLSFAQDEESVPLLHQKQCSYSSLSLEETIRDDYCPCANEKPILPSKV